MSKVQPYDYCVATSNYSVRCARSVGCWLKDTTMNELPSSNQ
jgi:hypothetical protein